MQVGGIGIKRIGVATAGLAGVGALAYELVGQLRPHRHPRYNDAWHGWPVGPVHQQHPVRATLNEPRPSMPPAYHFGVDIAVDDAHPEAGHPEGRSHRVYAVEGGTVQVQPGNEFDSGDAKKLDVGHFAYWHTDWVGVVKPGQHVRAGQQIGWSVTNEWHVHLSEWQQLNGRRVWVDPLRAGGKIAPYADSTPPTVHDLGFYAPADDQWEYTPGRKAVSAAAAGTPLDPQHLSGLVDLRANVGDPQPLRGFWKDHPEFRVELLPARIAVTVRRHADGKVVLDQALDGTRLLAGQVSIGDYFAPGTVQNVPALQAYRGDAGRPPAGTYWLRAFAGPGRAYWDTRAVRDGAYDVDLRVSDDHGNTTRVRQLVRVDNATLAAADPGAAPAPVAGLPTELDPSAPVGQLAP